MKNWRQFVKQPTFPRNKFGMSETSRWIGLFSKFVKFQLVKSGNRQEITRKHNVVQGLNFHRSNERNRARKGSLSNHDDDGNKNPTNLHIWQWKTVFLHALHVHFSCFDILMTFSFFLRREMTCFAVVWTTLAYDDKCSNLSSYVPSAGSNLIPG